MEKNLKFETRDPLWERNESDRAMLRCHLKQWKGEVPFAGGINQKENPWRERKETILWPSGENHSAKTSFWKKNKGKTFGGSNPTTKFEKQKNLGKKNHGIKNLSTWWWFMYTWWCRQNPQFIRKREKKYRKGKTVTVSFPQRNFKRRPERRTP